MMRVIEPRAISRVLAIVIALGSVFPVWAQEVIAPEELRDEVLAADDEERKDGWSYGASVGITGSFTHSSNVVGAVDGITVQLGAVLNGALLFVQGQHEWESTLDVKHTQSLTPQLDSFVKSADELVFQSTYSYRFEAVDWLGLFARFRLETQLFPGYDVRPDAVRVIRTLSTDDSDGNPEQIVEDIPAQEQIPLTGAFEPLILKESFGVFANPIEKKTLTIKTKLGLGAQHIIVQDGFALKDNDDTPELELIQLENSTQFGGEIELNFNGLINEGVTWKARAYFFYPFVTLADTEIEGIDLLTSDLSAALSVKLGKWASLDYVFSAKRIPLVLDAWQVQNGLMLTAGFNLL